MSDTTVRSAFATVAAGDPARPFVTHLGPDGARTELSVRTFENNVAKTANLLRDEGDVGQGSVVVLRLPLHWQASVWLAACAELGALAWMDGDPADPAVDVALLGPDELDAPHAPLTLATALHPLGMPFASPLPAGVLDAAVEVRMHADRFAPYDVPPASSPWLRLGERTWTQAEALADAAALAESVGAPANGRVLCARPVDEQGLLCLLAVPLAVTGSVVLRPEVPGAPGPLEDVAARERCDAVVR
ncbi:MAG: TIGR03089 family protein [Frankiales bacterium]|nr:TIGR03089 family protein [Frankiales bacterium]